MDPIEIPPTKAIHAVATAAVERTVDLHDVIAKNGYFWEKPQEHFDAIAAELRAKEENVPCNVKFYALGADPRLKSDNTFDGLSWDSRHAEEKTGCWRTPDAFNFDEELKKAVKAQAGGAERVGVELPVDLGGEWMVHDPKASSYV